MSTIRKVAVVTMSAFFVLNLSACGMWWTREPVSKTTVVQKYQNELDLQEVPGTVKGPWVGRMQQDVVVPGQIDPSNTYYRMPHRTIVEIRQQKYQRAQYPDLDGVYRERD